MAIELYLLSMFVAMTLLGYLIAINAHGPMRLSVSYLIATLMLAGTVWAIVQYVNTGLDKQKLEEFKRLEVEKQKAEDRVQSQQLELMDNKARLGYVTKLNDVINEGTGLSSTMVNIEMRDFSVELDVLMARAAEMKRKCDALKEKYDKVEKEQQFFAEGKTMMHDALDQLIGAATYYSMYFKSEDGAQEEMRERMMRDKARRANDLFKKAASQLASQN
jgi:hypothetical protein